MGESTSAAVAAGRVVQVSVSNGGVPKRAVPEALFTEQGIQGDRQRNRRIHGGPRRAVCLLALEVIDALRAQGHPIAPGAAGENLTVAGIPWARVRPGVRLRAGEALLEVTSFTRPCATIAGCFVDGDTSRLDARHVPDASRVYARVLTPGRVRPGDLVLVVTHQQPPTAP